MSNHANGRSVLVVGASIAGPTLAYWLTRYGFRVTVVEKGPGPRAGGHSVDLRGPTLEIAEKMGVLSRARSNHVDINKVTFVNEGGDLVGTITPQLISGGEAGLDVEIPRGELVHALIELTGDAAEWVFDESIVNLNDGEDGVEVEFASGGRRTYDLLIGADGARSRTRRLAIDPTNDALKYLGYCFALYALPNYLELDGENLSWNIAGKMAVMLPTEDDARVHAMLAFVEPQPPAELHGEVDLARAFVAEHFAGYGWEVPTMLEALRTAENPYFDTANYVELPAWSSGRVGLVGDAGYCPSLFTGQGSALAMIGSYILAAELAKTEDHVEAFAEYERVLRPFVTDVQKTIPGMIFSLAPRTAEDLAAHDAAIRNPELMAGDDGPVMHASITLPDYSAIQSTQPA